MISVEQWRAAIGCFVQRSVCKSVNMCTRENMCENLTKCNNCWYHDTTLCLLVYACIVGMLLIVSGNVELNPGPCKKKMS